MSQTIASYALCAGPFWPADGLTYLLELNPIDLYILFRRFILKTAMRLMKGSVAS